MGRRKKEGPVNEVSQEEREIQRAARVQEIIDGWQNEAWQVACNRMQLAIGKRHFAYAHRILDQFIHREREEISLDSFIAAMDGFVEARALESLDENGFDTIRSVYFAKDCELRRCRNIGEIAIAQIRSFCELVKDGVKLTVR